MLDDGAPWLGDAVFMALSAIDAGGAEAVVIQQGALTQQNRYPTLVITSNKMLPESRIYVMTLWRTNAGINKTLGLHDEHVK